MFTRSPTGEPKKLEPLKSNSGPSLNAAPQPQQQRRAAQSEPGAKSVIGNDLKIIGQGLKIISQGTLQVDGEVEGDVGGSEVIIGEKGKVTGTVAAERVMDVMRLDREVGDGELDLMRPQPRRLALRGEVLRAPEIEEDIGALPD